MVFFSDTGPCDTAPAVATSPIEVDLAMQGPNPGYSSSGYDTGTASLAASVNDYIFENGRRYHVYYGRDKNLLPDDEMEQDRLDLHHEIILRLMDGRLHCAPISEPKHILDIGTGTGIWSIDMADSYPSARVVGTDLSPIQPAWVPPNCHFELDDFEQEWLFKPDTFDFVHGRNISTSVSNWKNLLERAFRCTKPGGYVELAELGCRVFCDDGTMQPDDPIAYHFSLVSLSIAKIGRQFIEAAAMEKELREAGFVDVQIKAYRQPLGPWPKDCTLKHVGALVLLNGETAFHSYGLAAFTRILRLPVEEAHRICSAAYESLKNSHIHRYNLFYVGWGRKPEGATTAVGDPGADRSTAGPDAAMVGLGAALSGLDTATTGHDATAVGLDTATAGGDTAALAHETTISGPDATQAGEAHARVG